MTTADYIRENNKRLQAQQQPYNPLTGEGCTACPRSKVSIADFPNTPLMWLPTKMIECEPVAAKLIRAKTVKKYLVSQGIEPTEIAVNFFAWRFNTMRFFYDIEFWFRLAWNIEIKLSPTTLADGTAGTFQPLICNKGQQVLLKYIYQDIYDNKPLRYIICKSRQWGCSTFFAGISGWIQNIRKIGYNSAVAAHIEDAASTIRAMYINAIEEQPPIYICNPEQTINSEQGKLLPYRRSSKTLAFKPRKYTISIGSSQKPDGLRSKNINIAHLSEVAYFESTKKRTPEALCQSITASVPLLPETLIVYESTPSGTGNFFHREYIRAKRAENSFTAIFVPWYIIEAYSMPIADYKEFIQTLTPKEKRLFSLGATLEAIAWYRQKAKEYSETWRFISEFPSDDIEAFQSSGRLVFNLDDVERMRKLCRPPLHTGEVVSNVSIYDRACLNNLFFEPNPNGKLSVWAFPDTTQNITSRYLVTMDVGKGLSDTADYSVIRVIDRYYMIEGGIPEIVAQWRGHSDKDIAVWKALQIAKFYQNALLVVEKNSLIPKATDYSQMVLDIVKEYYSNIYFETRTDRITGKPVRKYGFHTGHASKLKVIEHQKTMIRLNQSTGMTGYYDPCILAIDEHGTFEIKPDGTMGAIDGNKDDILMSTAIGLWVCYNDMPLPQYKEDNFNQKNNFANTDVTFF